MDIFKKMGITVGMPSLIQEQTSKSLSDREIMEGQSVRKGHGSNPRDVLEAQLTKGGVSVEGLDDTSGESFHSDNDKEVEKLQKETKEIEVEDTEKSFSDSDLLMKALGDLCEEPAPKKKSYAKKGDVKVEITHKEDEMDKAFPVPPKKPSFQLKKEPKDAEQKKEEKQQEREAGIDKGRCWDGYKPAPGKKPFAEDSCVKKGDTPKIPGVSKKEIEKIASLHENSPLVAEQGKGQPMPKKAKNPFIKSEGPGGVYFDFGALTGNPLADNATAILNQSFDPIQAQIAVSQRADMDKAMQNYVTKGHDVYTREAMGYDNTDLNGTAMLSKPMDVQVKESFEKGEFGGNNAPAQTPTIKADFHKTEMNLNGEVIKGMSETDAAVIEMMKGMMNNHDESGVIAEVGGNKVTIDI